MAIEEDLLLCEGSRYDDASSPSRLCTETGMARLRLQCKKAHVWKEDGVLPYQGGC